MNRLKTLFSSIQKFCTIDFRGSNSKSIKRLAFEKGCMYAIEPQEKDEFAEFEGINKTYMLKSYEQFKSRLAPHIRAKVIKSDEEIREFFVSGFNISWNCPLIANQVCCMSKFDFIDFYGKQNFLNLLWRNSKWMEKKGIPPVLSFVW